VIITAYGSIDTAIAALRKGAVDYVLKPVEFDELIVKIDRLLQSRRLSLENNCCAENSIASTPSIKSSARVRPCSKSLI